mmetsp:Transcript_44680/g.95079  ORF Transcript_44680/g.95079 Transcript_44680/m.95079 type:complete len:125 (-) Transcript_44680:811-1185(-)
MEGNNDRTKARALDGVTMVPSVGSRGLLPYLLPWLLGTPLTISHAEALGSVLGSTAGTIHMHFGTIIPSLLRAMMWRRREKAREEAVGYLRALCHNVDTTGVNRLTGEITGKCAHDKEPARKEA